jgi:hypothetical protein
MKLVSILVLLTPYIANSMSVEVGSQASYFIQPNSQYFHQSSGAFLGIASTKKKLIWRFSYIERQQFRTDTFADGEIGLFTHIGTQLKSNKFLQLFAFLGGGKMHGYINEKDLQVRRSYTLSGVSSSAEARTSLLDLHFALHLQTFVGFDGNYQLKYYVAWPFTIIALRVSFELS